MTTSAAGKTEIGVSGSRGEKMVARVWRGQTIKEKASDYRRYLYENGVLKIERIRGNLGVLMLQADRDGFSEFTVMSFWPDRAAIASWAGENIAKTRHLDRDKEFLLALPDTVEHADVYVNDWLLNHTPVAGMNRNGQ
jgi:heme-degrading monooxygenase HmoA